MSFELRITITGLCMFVPDPDGRRMHVLMPRFGNHEPSISYDPSLEPPGTSHPLPCTAPGSVCLREYAVDFSTLKTGPGSLRLPYQVVDLYPITQIGIPRGHFDRNADAYVFSRVTLPPAASVTKIGVGAQWNLPPYFKIEMWPGVVWHVPVLDTAVAWSRLKLRDNSSAEILPTLAPDNTGIDITLRHVPIPDPCTIPPANQPYFSPHFPGYYKLFSPTATGDSPLLLQSPPDACTLAQLERDHGGSPYTCMVAGAPPGPP